MFLFLPQVEAVVGQHQTDFVRKTYAPGVVRSCHHCLVQVIGSLAFDWNGLILKLNLKRKLKEGRIEGREGGKGGKGGRREKGREGGKERGREGRKERGREGRIIYFIFIIVGRKGGKEPRKKG